MFSCLRPVTVALLSCSNAGLIEQACAHDQVLVARPVAADLLSCSTVVCTFHSSFCSLYGVLHWLEKQ